MKNYFKKFSIMFMMVLMFVGIGMIYGGSGANAATLGSTIATKENGWERYDDTNNNISYIGSFGRSDWAKGHYGSGTLLVMNSNETNRVKFNFTKSKLRLYGVGYPSLSGHNIVTIDGKDYDMYPYNKISNNVVALTFDIENLSDGEHCVEIRNNGCSRIYLDALDIDKDGALLPFNGFISLDKSTMNLTQDDSGQLTATTTPAGAQVTWKSSDASIATVDSTGKVTAMKAGTCTITVTTADGLTATCVVTVMPKGTDPNPQPTDTEYITNIAHAKGTNTNNPGGDVTIIFHGSADTTLSVVKTADVKDVWGGDNFTYTIVVTNTGTKTAKAVIVSDPAPNHIDFNVSGVTTTQGSVDSSSTSKNIIVNVGDIPPAGTVTIKVPATVIA
jgi:uncharacterized repeat protein (TIGR01451 family)